MPYRGVVDRASDLFEHSRGQRLGAEPRRAGAAVVIEDAEEGDVRLRVLRFAAVVMVMGTRARGTGSERRRGSEQGEYVG